VPERRCAGQQAPLSALYVRRELEQLAHRCRRHRRFEREAVMSCSLNLNALSRLPLAPVLVFSAWNTMSTAAKFAISMPAETMTLVTRAAKRLGMTRSRYIATVLEQLALRERDGAISARVDEVLAELGEQELSAVAHLHAARKNGGTEW